MNYKTLLAAALAACLLNGCTTVALWDEYDSGTITMERRESATDTVVGFARVKPNSDKLPPNSVVMLGDSYVYVLKIALRRDSGDGKAVDLAAILNVKLSQAFELHGNWLGTAPPRAPTADSRLPAFPVALSHNKPKQFGSSFCLIYPENMRLSAAQRRREQAELDKLHFQTVQLKNGTSARLQCLDVWGELYTKPDSLQYDYRFDTPLPVSISTVTTYATPARGGAWRTLLTPFTAAVDLVTLPITVPLGMKALEGVAEGWR